MEISPREETIEELVATWRRIFGERRLTAEDFQTLLDRVRRTDVVGGIERSEMSEAAYAALDVANATHDIRAEIRAALDVLDRMDERIRSIELTVNHLEKLQNTK